MADFSFAFTEGSFLLLKGPKHLRSVAEDLINNKKKEQNEFINLVVLYSSSFLAGVSNVALLKSTNNFHGILCLQF